MPDATQRGHVTPERREDSLHLVVLPAGQGDAGEQLRVGACHERGVDGPTVEGLEFDDAWPVTVLELEFGGERGPGAGELHVIRARHGVLGVGQALDQLAVGGP